jgi:serine/threonine-protein kinase
MRSIFDAIVDAPRAERADRLASLCEGDIELRREVESLLESDDSAEAELDAMLFGGGARAPVTDPLGLSGTSFSHFRVHAPLGIGGMGVVYAAEDTRLGRAVALKLPLPGRLIDPPSKERFLHEARSAAALDHPNLCSIYEAGETDDGLPFIAMALYPGETLRARLAQMGALPVAQAVEIGRRIAEGLAAAHAAGVIHRDLKPANVMLLPQGAVKILDFGLAKARDLSLTASWARLGTVGYMAPEQVHGHDVDARADLWALGAVLYEMVNGRRPFEGGHEIGIAHAIVHDELPPPAGQLRGMAKPLDALIRELLRKDPAGRPQSAEQVAGDLAVIAEGADVPVRRMRSPRPLPLPGRLRPLRVLTIAGALLAILAFGVSLLRRSLSPSPGPVRVAVLPFGWAGDSAAVHHLAIGMSDAIGRDLGRLANAIVPGQVTVRPYGGDSSSLRRIAAELGVGSALRGDVRFENGMLRVQAELIDAGEARPRLVRRYSVPFDSLPWVKADILQSAVSALGIRPAEGEAALIERLATTDARAWDIYLRARTLELGGQSRELWHVVPIDVIRRSQSLYAQARDVDPGFAEARARLALAHAAAARSYDPSEARREQARLDAEAALRLEPDLPEAHEALAYYSELSGDLPKAIEELGMAIGHFANSSDLRLARGRVLARAGRLDDAMVDFEEAMRLEPGSPKAAFAAAVFYLRLRRDEEAMRAFDRALLLAPAYHMAKVIKGHTYLRWKGTPDTLAAAMAGVPLDWDPNGMATWARFTALWTQRKHAEALAMLDRSGIELSRDGYVYQPIALMRARLYDWMGNRSAARIHYQAARAAIRDSLAANPDDASIHIALGLANAGLGRTSEAVRDARRAMELVPLGRDAPGATAFMGGAVEVYARAGEEGPALELIELLFTMPAGREVTAAFLRVWPGFDPLRSDSRFAELLERFDPAG